DQAAGRPGDARGVLLPPQLAGRRSPDVGQFHDSASRDQRLPAPAAPADASRDGERDRADLIRAMRVRLLAWMVALACAVPAHAESYPERPIRLIVPFAAGGTVDIVARVVGAKLGEIARSKVVIDNRGGAGGVIGTEMTAQAPGDGYTLLMHSASITY